MGYGGIYTSGKNGDINSFQNYKRNQKKIVTGFRNTLEKLMSEGKLPFKLTFETDSDAVKLDTNDVYSLALVMTRDDINNETFESPDSGTKINKTYVNVGMVAILYQTVDEPGNKGKKNSIVFSLPVVGYSINVSGKDGMSQEESDTMFVKVANSTLENVLAERLKKISIDNLSGKIKKIADNKAVIDIGSANGLIMGQTVKFVQSGNLVTRGKVENISLNEATIITAANFDKLKEGTDIEASNIKGTSSETYQVVGFKISSEKCKKWFDENSIGPQASQWFSDYLSERGGKVVLPSKIGNTWVEASNEQSFAVFIKDGQEHLFEVAKPKYRVILDLTGLSDKKIEEESNNINENWIFKLWMNVEIPEKKYSKEFDTISTKSIIVGTQSFEEKTEVFDLLHQLTAKSAKEID
ncbi:MAG: hypothetical protein H7263_09410 [Candidatus Sericytochromatia bacterium]|nr:hypothetical protein [Candidatus Sericytochromatia bacterium]